MPIRRISSPSVPEPRPGMWSNCLLVDGVAYVSGLTSRAADLVTIEGADEYAQTRIVFRKMQMLIEAAGGSMADVVKLTIFVTRIRNREQVWKARSEFFSGDFPACSLVEVSNLAADNIYVEIEGIAHIGAGKP
jgi:enamine deaminase RidA (YjgF/YER057c/UK114 family)